MPWRSALETIVALAQPMLRGPHCALIGSAASALQGCRVVPGDIDLLAVDPEAVSCFAGLMAAYTPPHGEHSTDHARWLSSQETPLSTGPDDWGFFWHFGRWQVDGIKVEIAHIAAPEGAKTSADGAGIWEAGPEIWPHIRFVPLAGMSVPVVPLEIQLGTNLSRGLEERAAEIVAVLRRDGYDGELIHRALHSKHLPRFEATMKGPANQA
jgi:hypothetical protein